MDKNIPLSELIRIGSKVSGQCRGCYTDIDGNTCAIGAAYLAKYGEPITPETCIGGFLESLPLHIPSAIIERNDDGQTREQIADWLEGMGL